MAAMNINKEKAIKLINLLIIQKDSFTKIKKKLQHRRTNGVSQLISLIACDRHLESRLQYRWRERRWCERFCVVSKMSFISNRADVIDLLEGVDHAIMRIEPLHVLDERRIVYLRFARENDAGADRLRLRLAARQDLQVSIYRVRVSCKRIKPQTVIIIDVGGYMFACSTSVRDAGKKHRSRSND